jgi:hypothetical protein
MALFIAARLRVRIPASETDQESEIERPVQGLSAGKRARPSLIWAFRLAWLWILDWGCWAGRGHVDWEVRNQSLHRNEMSRGVNELLQILEILTNPPALIMSLIIAQPSGA